MKNTRRKRFISWFRRSRWTLIAGAAVLALVLGYLGFRRTFIALGGPRSPSDLFYLTLQLFVLESGSIRGPLSWELELARFLAPAVAAYAAIQALAVIFRDEIQLLRVRFMRNQAIVCGLGQKGLLLTRRLVRNGRRVVVVEQDSENELIVRCREAGGLVLIGDASSREVLSKAGVQRAGSLISVCGNDGVNAEVALVARDLAGLRGGSPLTCAVHIFDPQLCRMLRERELASGKAENFRLEFFNIFEIGARTWLGEYPIVPESSAGASPSPHLLIVGLGKMGESLTIQAARKWRETSPPAERRLKATVIDHAAKAKVSLFHLKYPHLEKTCELIPLDLDINSAGFERGDFLLDERRRPAVTGIHICLDNDSLALSTALALYRLTGGSEIPIVVRTGREGGLTTLLRREEESQERPRLFAFGLLDRTCRPEFILAGVNEILARAIHEEYVRRQKKAGETVQTNPALVAWEELPETLRESNRRQADHIGVKLAAVSCTIAPLVDWDAEEFRFRGDEVELLAKLEHERWLAERLHSAWKYSPGPKDVERKRSPYLASWEDLPEDIRELDRNAMRALPPLLAKIDLQIFRRSR
jgi:hypothetical protein